MADKTSEQILRVTQDVGQVKVDVARVEEKVSAMNEKLDTHSQLMSDKFDTNNTELTEIKTMLMTTLANQNKTDNRLTRIERDHNWAAAIVALLWGGLVAWVQKKFRGA